jgi:hypothetical protein
VHPQAPFARHSVNGNWSVGMQPSPQQDWSLGQQFLGAGGKTSQQVVSVTGHSVKGNSSVGMQPDPQQDWPAGQHFSTLGGRSGGNGAARDGLLRSQAEGRCGLFLGCAAGAYAQRLLLCAALGHLHACACVRSCIPQELSVPRCVQAVAIGGRSSPKLR